MADARSAAGLAVGLFAGQVKRHPVQPDHSGAVFNPAQYRQQFRLAVARHPGNPQNFAGTDRQGYAFQPFHPLVIGNFKVFHFQHYLAGLHGAFDHIQQHLSPHHPFRQVFGAGVSGPDRRGHFTAPHHRYGIGHFHDFAQLVGDQDDGFTLLLQALEDTEQMVGFVRGQNPGRLIQDQDIGLAVQRFQNLHPLLMPDRQVFDQLIRIDVQFIVIGQLRQHLARLGQRRAQQSAVFHPEDHVFQHGKVLHQLEMLKHHADSGTDRALAVGDLRHCAVDQNFTGVGAVETIKDRHQRRFSGTVFADDAVDRATSDRNRNILVGLYRAKGFGYAAQFDGGWYSQSGRCLPLRCRGDGHRPCPTSPGPYITGQVLSDM